ncbi:SLC13 family permease [Rhodothermus profundi]|uniref:Solute carrier family 13 (Sodium-dependent dicarboxylate transporter), member 2/3/5 n=1 Tax=Rhodothermus profundi TaxID=633813 RepID=A0A1M6PGA0_9BACT|nr:SLC13 family permease [Rhodothermus profundi]SHK06978.1 solute carrier family 13 (sodium-dependent dicarboxylate transporter), member 2/3/5 [Rhodothermus profundi]
MTRRQQWGFWLGPLVFLGFVLLPRPEGLSQAAWYAAAVSLWMAIWWITEAIPIPATALLPIVLFPLLGVRSVGDATAPYAHPIIFLFMGGFLLAQAMQRWRLHRRLALHIIRRVGTRPARLILGFLLAGAFLSLWVSNTATALMMLPIGLSVLELLEERVAETPALHAFKAALVLSIAYGCNIGGMGTLIGTPPNALLAGFLSETYGYGLSFAGWLPLGIPVVALGLLLTYLFLVYGLFPAGRQLQVEAAELIQAELEALGPVHPAERRIAWIFAGTALLWIARPVLSRWIPGLSDAGIAMGAALVLFLLPAEPGRRLLDWESARHLPWGLLLLFGGGLSMAGAITGTGLAHWIGEQVRVLAGWPPWVIVLLATGTIVFLTEITSNTAVTAAFLPVLASAAVGLGQNPLLLAVPATLGASCAFMLPVATPPNAVVYSTGRVSMLEMARAGFWLNLLFIGLLTLLAFTLLPRVLDVQPGVVPPWVHP